MRIKAGHCAGICFGKWPEPEEGTTAAELRGR